MGIKYEHMVNGVPLEIGLDVAREMAGDPNAKPADFECLVLDQTPGETTYEVFVKSPSSSDSLYDRLGEIVVGPKADEAGKKWLDRNVSS